MSRTLAVVGFDCGNAVLSFDGMLPYFGSRESASVNDRQPAASLTHFAGGALPQNASD